LLPKENSAAFVKNHVKVFEREIKIALNNEKKKNCTEILDILTDMQKSLLECYSILPKAFRLLLRQPQQQDSLGQVCNLIKKGESGSEKEIIATTAKIFRERYKKIVQGRLMHASKDFRCALGKYGRPVTNLSELTRGRIYVLAPAKKDAWRKHSAILIDPFTKEGTLTFREIIQLGNMPENKINEKEKEFLAFVPVPKKKETDASGNGYFLNRLKEGKTTQAYRNQLDYFIHEKLLYELDKEFTASIIEKSTKITAGKIMLANEFENKNAPKIRYLGASYNCNHAMFDIVKEAIKIVKSENEEKK